MKPVVLSVEGRKALEEELETLVTVTRMEIAEKLKVARGYGDLSENSEYDEAKNEQAKIEARIEEIQNMLKNAKMLDVDTNSAVISLGSKIKVFNKTFNQEAVYSIVSSAESDVSKGKLSDESPVGKSFLGHTAGETVAVTVPSGDVMEFDILEIVR